MISTRILRWLAAGGLSAAAFGQPNIAPVPKDALEMVTGPAQVAGSIQNHEAALQLLDGARSRYGLRESNLAYDLKVSFTVNSGGQTNYDGTWTMEDISDPTHGLRWTATSSSGYTTTQISANGTFFGQGTPGGFPLRLQEARAALYDPMPNSSDASADLIRTFNNVSPNGTQLVCVLLSGGPNTSPLTSRRWEETEECIDPQSGLLRLHSQSPGRFYSYDYTNAFQLGNYVLPRTVTVTEGGNVVSTITVQSLTAISSPDPSLFVATDQMKANGPSIAMGEAIKFNAFAGKRPQAGGTIHPVSLFGLVTPTGQLVEAHSLQPSDPNSAAAIAAAKKLRFAHPLTATGRPQQHFVFITEKFASPE